MAKMRAVDAAMYVLEKEGITTAFGVPGAAINPFYSAMRKHGGIRHILARHVEGASHMAEGYTRATAGNIGVCLGTSGPAGTDMITALCRTVILYFLIMIGLRLMGKRQIGELEPSELVLTMMISDLATVPMQDFGIPLLAGVIPILILLSLTLLMSQLSLLNLRFRALMCGTPAILIRNGKLQQAAMRKNRYTLDELLEQLRGQGCLSVEEVQYAVLENSGQLSVLPWAKAKPPTAEDLSLTLEEDALPTVLINDGRVLRNNLRLCGRDEVWLQKILKQEHCSAKEVFLLTVDENGKTLCVPKEADP